MEFSAESERIWEDFLEFSNIWRYILQVYSEVAEHGLQLSDINSEL